MKRLMTMMTALLLIVAPVAAFADPYGNKNGQEFGCEPAAKEGTNILTYSDDCVAGEVFTGGVTGSTTTTTVETIEGGKYGPDIERTTRTTTFSGRPSERPADKVRVTDRVIERENDTDHDES